jgi:hypothetical protein
MNLFDFFLRKRALKAVTARRRRPSDPTPPGPSSRSAAPAQEVLSSAAAAWLRSLPPTLRPMHLCNAFPRVANRIALAWGDPDLADGVFNELLLDRRGNRKGFPPAVASEILRLHAYHEQRSLAARIGAA